MVTTASIAQIGALIRDQARLAMLRALMDGRALTATELARTAGITAQTASSHLAQLIERALVNVTKQGRHRYHRLAAGPHMARVLEALADTTSDGTSLKARSGPRDPHMRLARTCYGHLAGWLGVAIADSLAARGWVEINEGSARVSAMGLARLAALNLDAAVRLEGDQSDKLECRPCLDWSERRPHLAGSLGIALCQHGLKHDWVRRRAGSRALDVTSTGWRTLSDLFEIKLPR